ncbi:type I-E CRISPR-associated protein Cas7/Cse4/CasC [Castellaniella sp.]|uniref:type I-E CRISPR-associated protein Cas7/Cse4/CasC n=1 Tax=Castellaniella sp. TaxID=1955812 RepID=UPI003560630B
MNAPIRIEFHILQSFPVTCLNRDDLGAPKTALIGGALRARVSSQCWKRQVRLALPTFGVKLATRTRQAQLLFARACRRVGASDALAQECGQCLADLIVSDALLFISDTEAAAFAEYARALDFEKARFKERDLARIAKKVINPAVDALDIALFGRMVARAPDMNIEAAASFSHAISTHRVANELEFFTALDDLQPGPGSAHMGSMEFNSATYYRYISLDVGQLAQTLASEDLQQAVDAFVRALFVAVPGARQASQSGASPWEFARVLVRRGQRLQASFEAPVTDQGHGYLQPSIEALKAYLDKKEKLSGSLFGKLAAYDWGEDERFSIDDLIGRLRTHVS